MAVKIRPSDEVVQENIKKWNIPQPDREYTVLIHCSTYNHGMYIKDALEGFVMQKCSYSFCAIIIDDGSTDNNQEIIRKYAEKYPNIIKPILLGENHMQHGILRDPYFEKWHERAKYIAFCEGDDYWIDPLKLQKQVEILEKDQTIGVVYAKSKRFNNMERCFEGVIGEKFREFDEMLVENRIPTLTACFRRDLYNLYCTSAPQEISNRSLGDYQMWLFFLLHSKAFFINEVFAVYRVLEESASHSRSTEKMIKYMDDVRKIQLFFLNNYPDFVHNHKRVLNAVLDRYEWGVYRIMKNESAKYELTKEKVNRLSLKHLILYYFNRIFL